jgi:hypothetical protein
MKVTFEAFGITKRQYNASTPIYTTNEQHDPKNGSYFVVHEGQDITEGRFNPVHKMITTPRTRFKWLSDSIFEHHVLHTKKRAYKDGNYSTYQYKIICVGDKRPSTHLPAGLLFQLQLIQ